jgi:hypothetical protein
MKHLHFLLAVFCPIFFTVCSCATGGNDPAAIILGESSRPPVFLSCKAVTETEINFEFDKPVTVKALHFSPDVEVEAIENGRIVKVMVSGGPGPGERLTADLLVEDGKKNTINVLVPFRTRNGRMPPLRINELRTENTKPKCEFIELKTLGPGNLGALRVFAVSNAKNPLIYEFPSIEVPAGEYITLHLRSVDEGIRDELGSSLAESGGANSSDTARDLWVPGNAKLLRKTDAVYLLDQDGRVVDAVMLSENADSVWRGEHFSEAAEFLFEAGAWKSKDGKPALPADAVQSAGTTNTRTINRDETLAKYSGTQADWYITAASGATPGKPNNPKRYNP